MLTNTEIEFIKNNIDCKVEELLLKSHQNDVDIRKVARQIESRQKAKFKLPTFYKNLDLIFPSKLSIEQSSSEVTADYKANICNYNSVCDLTGGFGVDSYYFQKKAKKLFYVEKNNELFEIVQYNFNIFGYKNIDFYNESAENFCLNMPEVDLCYIDPSRRVESKKVFFLKDSEPDILNLIDEIKKKAKIIMIKASPMLDISSARNAIKSINSIKVISFDNECKELLLIVDSERNEFEIEAIELKNNINFKFDDRICEINLSAPLKFLYEPNAALIKANGQDRYAIEMKLMKLHRFTNLFTSNELIGNYFGRSFEIITTTRFTRKEIGHFLPNNKANISVRNFPMKADEVRKKLRIDDGGDIYIFAATDLNEKKIAIICKKL